MKDGKWKKFDDNKSKCFRCGKEYSKLIMYYDLDNRYYCKSCNNYLKAMEEQIEMLEQKVKERRLKKK